MDELEEIKKKKMERMMREMNKADEPAIELPGKPIIVTDATVDAAASQYPVLILDCWAEWCGPCRMIAPVIEELAREMKGKVVFGKLDVDKNPLTANRYRISAIPTLMVFKNGKYIDKIIGFGGKAKLVADIQRFL